MACGHPMFPGSGVEEQLLLIWKVKRIAATVLCSQISFFSYLARQMKKHGLALIKMKILPLHNIQTLSQNQ